MASYKPPNWPSVIPRISVDDPKSLVEFIHDVFNATGEYQSSRPTELRIDDSLIMVGSTIEREALSAFLYVYVSDVDGVYQKAIGRGAVSIEEPLNMPYGDRRAMFRDPWGTRWQVATHSGQFKS